MNRFWEQVLSPLICVAKPRIILQIGAKEALLAQHLVETAKLVGATIHIVSLRPLFDIAEMRRNAGDELVFHPARGVDAIALLPPADLVLIDDDPNWYTVSHLLMAIERKAANAKRSFPIVAVNNIGWPYGRRDSYDDPGSIPESCRLPFERAGITPGLAALTASSGLFRDCFNAAEEHAPRSGVLTALEDFLAERSDRVMMSALPMFHGLALLRPLGRPAQGEIEALLGALTLGRSAAAIVSDLEAARVRLEHEVGSLRQELERATHRNGALHDALRHEQQQKPPPNRRTFAGLSRTLAAPLSLGSAATPKASLNGHSALGSTSDLDASRANPRLARTRQDPSGAGQLNATMPAERPQKPAPPHRAVSRELQRAFVGLHAKSVDEQSAASLLRALLRRLRRVAVARMHGPSANDHVIAAELARLRASILFDAEWYAARYADVIGTMEPALHYLTFGRIFRLDPGPDFSATYYLSTYRDVAEAGLDPLLHYLSSGAREGRDPSARFRTGYYLRTNPEVGEAGANPLEHYVRYGRDEGRRPTDADLVEL